MSPCQLFILPEWEWLHFVSFSWLRPTCLQPQLHWHHLLEITLDFLLLTQPYMLGAHIVLGWDTLMNHIVMFCVLKSVCFSLPLDFLSPLGFLRSGPVSYTLLYPKHLVSLQNNPFSWQHVVLVWWACRDFWERQLGAQSPLCHPHYISHADNMSISSLCTTTAFMWTSGPHLDHCTSSRTFAIFSLSLQLLLPVCPTDCKINLPKLRVQLLLAFLSLPWDYKCIISRLMSTVPELCLMQNRYWNYLTVLFSFFFSIIISLTFSKERSICPPGG